MKADEPVRKDTILRNPDGWVEVDVPMEMTHLKAVADSVQRAFVEGRIPVFAPGVRFIPFSPEMALRLKARRYLAAVSRLKHPHAKDDPVGALGQVATDFLQVIIGKEEKEKAVCALFDELWKAIKDGEDEPAREAAERLRAVLNAIEPETADAFRKAVVELPPAAPAAPTPEGKPMGKILGFPLTVDPAADVPLSLQSRTSGPEGDIVERVDVVDEGESMMKRLQRTLAFYGVSGGDLTQAVIVLPPDLLAALEREIVPSPGCHLSAYDGFELIVSPTAKPGLMRIVSRSRWEKELAANPPPFTNPGADGPVTVREPEVPAPPRLLKCSLCGVEYDPFQSSHEHAECHLADQLTLGQFIGQLARVDGKKKIEFLDGRPVRGLDSYRGFYDQLALESDREWAPPSAPRLVGNVLAEANMANGREFEGYKGGRYRMQLDTRIWASNHGECSGDEVVMVKEFPDRVVVLTKNPEREAAAAEAPLGEDA